ncbi:hypothetical protein [Zavarzinella formosa]|uniref:hypothetical protein n=1 Tax=Zavarzinella formosa TaxID=360055 RepID=UPI0002F607CE|nr:hypothetical protein [Zavarzinella formosa]
MDALAKIAPVCSVLVAVILPIFLFYIMPRSRERQRNALDLFNSFTSEAMHKTRLDAWAYFVTLVADDPAEQDTRFSHYLDYLTERKSKKPFSKDEIELFQKASKVLDFFAYVDACLREHLAGPQLVRTFLASYYLWWREELMEPLRKRRRLTTTNPQFVPYW